MLTHEQEVTELLLVPGKLWMAGPLGEAPGRTLLRVCINDGLKRPM